MQGVDGWISILINSVSFPGHSPLLWHHSKAKRKVVGAGFAAYYGDSNCASLLLTMQFGGVEGRVEKYNLYSRAMSRVTSIHGTEMNIRVPLWIFRDLNGILKISPKVGTKMYNN